MQSIRMHAGMGPCCMAHSTTHSTAVRSHASDTSHNFVASPELLLAARRSAFRVAELEHANVVPTVSTSRSQSVCTQGCAHDAMPHTLRWTLYSTRSCLTEHMHRAGALGPAAFLVPGGRTDHMLMQPSTEHFPFPQSIRMHARRDELTVHGPLHYTLYRTPPCLTSHNNFVASPELLLAARGSAFRVAERSAC
jgi:hypothetical protein